jgi:PKD repeat protein
MVNGGTIVTGQNTNAIDIHWDQSGQGGITIEESSAAGCKANAFLNVKINAVPVPDFTADPVCEGQIMAFINKTTNGFQYNWEFGDGGNSNDDNAFHRYAQAGSYIVHLNAFSSNGCTQSIQKNVQVVKTPTASFLVKKVCQGTPSYFENQSKNSNGYLWDFGDGKTSTDSAPVHVYSKPGVYHVNLTAFAASGCNNNVTLDAIVNPYPDASMLISRDKNVYKFMAYDSLETYYHWDFGDGVNSDLLKAKHEYGQEGLYKIHLDVINGFSCTVSKDTSLDFKYMLCTPEVYPNPFGAYFNISYCLAARSHLRMLMIDQLGQPIKVFDINQDAGAYNSNINATDLSLHSGAYIMQLWVNDNLYTQKLVHIR